MPTPPNMLEDECRVSPLRWLLLGLVFVAIALNYVDRQILAILKPTLAAEFGWSDTDYGNMTSAFQIAAAVGYLLAGWFIDRVGLRLGFALGVGVWSLAAMAHSFASSVTQFLAARTILGVAEATGTPAVVKSAATFFRASERSIALGICNTAPNIGAILTPLLIPPFAAAFGWRRSFIILGFLGLLWIPVWLRLYDRAASQDPAKQESRTPFCQVIADRRLLTVALAKVLSDSVWWFMLFFLPDLLYKRFGLGPKLLGLPLALAYAMAACGALSGGFLPAQLIRRGMTPSGARKLTLFAYALLTTCAPLVLLAKGAFLAAFLLGLLLFAHQGFSTNVLALGTDLFRAQSVASAIGIAAFWGNLAGAGMSQWVSFSLSHGHGYVPLLLFSGSAYLIAALLVSLLLR